MENLTVDLFDQERWDIATKEDLLSDDEGSATLSNSDSLDISFVMVLNAIAELKDMLENKKLAPDPRFEQLAEEIDELKREVKKLKSEKKLDDRLPLTE